jgi:hypothetical protein
VKLHPNVETPLKDKGPEHVDFVVVRENTGGIYTGIEGLDFDKLELPGRQSCVVDVESRPLVLFENEYLLGRAMEKYKGVTFISAVQPGRSYRAAA